MEPMMRVIYTEHPTSARLKEAGHIIGGYEKSKVSTNPIRWSERVKESVMGQTSLELHIETASNQATEGQLTRDQERGAQYLQKLARIQGKESYKGDKMIQLYNAQERKARETEEVVRACAEVGIKLLCLHEYKILVEVEEGRTIHEVMECIQSKMCRDHKISLKEHRVYRTLTWAPD
jgi:hypothetical protein